MTATITSAHGTWPISRPLRRFIAAQARLNRRDVDKDAKRQACLEMPYPEAGEFDDFVVFFLWKAADAWRTSTDVTLAGVSPLADGTWKVTEQFCRGENVHLRLRRGYVPSYPIKERRPCQP